MTIDESITIPNRTARQLYPLITRWDVLLPQIDPSVLQVTMKEPGRPFGVGTIYVERMTMLGRTVEITATITAETPPKRYDYTATSDGLTGGGTMTLEDNPTNGSVKFSVHIDLKPTTCMLKIVTALFGWKFRAAERARLATMKAKLASGDLVPP